MSVDFSDPVHWAFLFNSPLECGIRVLASLVSAYPAEYDLQRLLYLDYLVVHSSDGDRSAVAKTTSIESVHPPTPYRSSELIVRRDFVDRGVRLMVSRSLLVPVYDDAGIRYKAAEGAVPFLDSLSSPYVHDLREAASFMTKQFKGYSDTELSEWIRDRMGDWGAEFEFSTMVRPQGGDPWELL